jgi:hypothetical protein
MSGNSPSRWVAISIGGAAACVLALLAGAKLSSSASPELTVPASASTAVPIAGAQAAESALLPDYYRTIPLSSFGSGAAGLKPGVRLAVQTQSGKELTGTVVVVRETDLVMRVESWETVAPPSAPR